MRAIPTSVKVHQRANGRQNFAKEHFEQLPEGAHVTTVPAVTVSLPSRISVLARRRQFRRQIVASQG
jgi:hypothetical protein